MSTSTSTVTVTARSFEELVGKGGILLLDFWASWCGPCRSFAPTFEAAAARHTDLPVGQVDTDRETELASAFGIRSIPTLLIFRDGILVVQQPGAIPGAALDQLVASVRSLDMQDVRRRIDQDRPSGGAP